MLIEPTTFSIIIPTYNRIDQLSECLLAIEKQDYPKNCFEVIIVNDGGVPPDDLVATYLKRLDIKVINQTNTGPAQARNHGAAEARGQFLVFTDDDCRPAQDWLQQIAQCCTTNPDALMGGQTLNHLPDNLYSTASQLIVDVAYQYHNPDPEQARFFTSNNMVFPRLQFLKLRGFHPDFRTSEDREICDRWLCNGYPMHYTDSAKIYHAHALTLVSFWRQHLNYGRGAFFYHSIRASRGAAPFRPDFTFYGKLLVYPFQRLPMHRAIGVALLMGIAQVANTLGYLWAKWHSPQLSEVLSRELTPLHNSVRSG